ncbi:hypothetical protein [Mycolicibacterium setense]|uniref:hypothetical protein n=1 Tax=Mycolicibacterium setense TaxID=431269 RepID=UPI000574EFD4|nr:hypothetical protein [Mycolicibacterium setense]KHO21820.1 hypothetical protein QQ25_15095 [Mycolicibacterium setense]MCV7114011.1 hypothetical protein [Mycolicibacterium setense]
MTVTDNGNTTPDNANADDQHHDSSQTDDAGQTEPIGAEADDMPDSDQGDDAARKARREAAGLRKRLRETETERDELCAERDEIRAQRDAAREEIVAMIATTSGLPDLGLLAAAGHDAASFITDEGRVDRVKVTDACRDAMKRYRIGRPPAPNPQQASGVHQPGESTSQQWVAAFAPPKA